MRWQEEVSLTTYEMQWTVRYFTHKSSFWLETQNKPAEPILTSAELNLTSAKVNPGARAYAKRKESTWLRLALKSDKTFKIINKAYKSPL